jgi:hypothetical protein
MNYLIDHATFQLYCIAGLLGVAIAMLLMVFGVMFRATVLWFRFEKANGGFSNAMLLLKQLEDINGTDSMIRRGIRYAHKRRWI